MFPVLYSHIYIRLQKTSNNTVNVVLIGIQRKSFSKESNYFKIKTWFSMIDIYSSAGGNSPDGALYYEIPYLFYDELENLSFIKEMGIEINKI